MSAPAQRVLFFEDEYDALRSAVNALGGAKSVGSNLWPHIPIVDAQRKLLDCLNRERAEKLDTSELFAILRWAKEAGFHEAKHWIDRELGYQPTDPLDPKVEDDRLADTFALLAEEMRQLQRLMERRNEQPLGVRAVK